MSFMKPNNKTVVFIFSLSAKKEAERKPLFGTQKRSVSERFFKLLNKKTLSIAKKSGVDVVWLDEKKQQGANFNERFFNAYQSLFDQGYKNVISIGNDTPNLTTNHIKQAITLLSRQQIVYGPSKDGGVYLLGYTHTAFNAISFKNISWLTKNVTKELNSIATKEHISFSVLEELIDIDTEKSALEFAYSNPISLLSTFILQFLLIQIEKVTQLIVYTPKLLVSSFYLRGPPSLLH